MTQGRQRVINDHSFWRSKLLEKITAEDRAVLMYLLTSPYSNISGVYQILPRIAAAELGWDVESQFLPVLRRLAGDGFIAFDEVRSYIWVKIWWDHNSALGACSPSLTVNMAKELRAMPELWLRDFLISFLGQLPLCDKNLRPFRQRIANIYFDEHLFSQDDYGDIGLLCATPDVAEDGSSQNAELCAPEGEGAPPGCRHPVDTPSTPTSNVKGSLPGISKSIGIPTPNINLSSQFRVPNVLTAADEIEVGKLLAKVPQDVAQRLLDVLDDKERDIPVGKVVPYLRTAVKNYLRDIGGARPADVPLYEPKLRQDGLARQALDFLKKR